MAEDVVAFVGREYELGLLDAAVAEASDGNGSLWFLSGEAGIGKSRLAEETASAARARGMRVLWGRCWEAGGAPAYWPWVQVLRALLRAAPIDEYDRHRAGLSQILPELGSESNPADEGLSGEEARFRLMDAVSSTLLSAARDIPLVVIVEDLHVADESTVLLLDFLTTLVRGQPLLILSTLRPIEVGHALEPRLSGARRNGRELTLNRLDREAVARFARTGRAPLDDDQVEALLRATEGLPLFMIEVARLWQSGRPHQGPGDAPVPATVRAAIEERLGVLSDSTRRTLAHAAVVGREFEASLLREAVADPDAPMDAALAQGVAAAMIEDVGIDRYRFTHILIRDALYDGIPTEERTAAHRRIAGALSNDELGDKPWSEVAHHLRRVGPAAATDAAEAFRKAGHRAMAQFAFRDAVHAYEASQECWGTAETRDEAAEVAVMIELGRAQVLAGDVAQGKDTCLQAAARARELGSATLFAKAALERGSALLFAQIDHALVGLLAEALELLGPGDSEWYARTNARLAAAQQPAADPEEPFARARDAISMARRLGDDATLLHTFRDGGSAFVDLANPEERLPLDLEHAALAERLGNRIERLRATNRLVLDYAELGRIDEAYKTMATSEEIAQSLGHAAYRWRAVAMRAARALWEGRTDVAGKLVEEAGALGIQSGDRNAWPVYAIQKMRWLRLVGEFDDQAEVIEELERQWQEWGIGGALVNAIIGQEHLIGGRREAGLRRYEPSAVDTSIRVRDRTMQLALSRLCVAAGDRDQAEKLYAGALPYEHTLVTGGALFLSIDEPMSGALGRLAAFLGDTKKAEEHFERAVNEARRAGGQPVADALESERDAVMQPGRKRAAPPAQPVSMEATGESWVVRGGAVTFHLKDTKGVRMLAKLVAEPGREFHVLELSGAPETATEVIDRGDAGEVIDEEARRAYRQRAAQLQQEIDEAESFNDTGRLDKARAELEFLTAELARAVGLGGRTRRAGGASERARVNVQRRIRDALRRVRAQDPKLAKRLDKDLRTGTFCAYEPG